MSNSLVRKGLEILGYENRVKQGILLFLYFNLYRLQKYITVLQKKSLFYRKKETKTHKI